MLLLLTKVIVMSQIVKSITITKGYVISTNNCSNEQWNNLEEMLHNNEINIDELSDVLGFDVENRCAVHYEANVSNIAVAQPVKIG